MSDAQIPRIGNKEVRYWSDFLDLEIQIFNAYIFGLTGKVQLAFDPTALALLKANDAGLRKKVEAAIENRIATGDWSRFLQHDELVQLFYRAFNAHGALIVAASVQEGAPDLIQADSPFAAPDPTDRARFLRWLLVNSWNAGAEAFIAQLELQRLPLPS